MPTVRQEMIELLTASERSVRELSQLLRISEKQVFDHLTHIRSTLASQKRRLTLRPARCLECGYVFEDRRRVTRPGRCPRCRGEHIQDPTFRVD